MTNTILRTITFLIALAAVMLPASARDVSLDKIYISGKSPFLSRLNEAKFDAYIAAGARIADSDVAFCGWSSGSALVYVNDLDSHFDVYEMFLSSHVKRKIATVRGAVVYATIARNGKYLFAKSLVAEKGKILPDSIFIVVSIRTGQVQEFLSRNQFVDFSATPFGGSYLRENTDGIREYYPDNGTSKNILPESLYKKVMNSDGAIIPFLSPDADKIALLNGGGGYYKTYIFDKGVKTAELGGVSGSTEFSWLDSTHIAYRSGAAGSFSLMIYSYADGTSFAVGDRTMNTNLSYSPYNGMITFLQDGCLSFYSLKLKKYDVFALEGEDAAFSPNANSFCSLFDRKLFVTQFETIKQKTIEMKRAASAVLEIYRGVKNDKSSFNNEYSAEYIARKESLYRRLSR
jgi:hypothetical protein